jgi:hypothetical protein
MLKSYRIHQEQIENVRKNLIDIYNTPLVDPQPAGRPGRGRPRSKSGAKDPESRSRAGKIVWGTGAVKGPVTDMPAEGFPGNALSGPRVPAMLCPACSSYFPVSDFLYTKKSGLCISCWEEKVV